MEIGVCCKWEDVATSSEDIVYSVIHKFFLKSKGKEDRHKSLRLTISLGSLIGPVSEKSIAMKITDEEDPFVYYSLLISESDFLTIKEQQGLLIDYDKFPQQLIKLFGLCKESDVSPWKYHLILEELTSEPFGSCKITLKVIETNQFKQLCHLSLDVHVGTDSEIKRHLAQQMSVLKDLLTQAEARASQSDLNLQEVKKKLEAKCNELDEVQRCWREESNNHHQQALKELNAERDNYLKVQLDMKNSFESEKKQLQDMLDERKQYFDKKLVNLEIENKALYEKTFDLQSKLRETSQQLSNAKEDIYILQKDKERLCTQGSKLDADYHCKEKSLNVLKTRAAVLEQELKDKKALLDQQTKLLQVAHEQKALLESNLAEKDDKLQKKSSSLNALSQELCKANEIIHKLSKEVCFLKGRVNRRAAVISEQEKLLASKEKELADLKTKVDEYVNAISILQMSEQKLKQDLEAVESKIAEKDTTLSNNANLINWLNHRINQLHTSKETEKEQRLPNPAMTYSSTPRMPEYLQVTKRMIENAGVTNSQAMAATTVSINTTSPYQYSATKPSTESHESAGLEKPEGRGILQTTRLPVAHPGPSVARVSPGPVNPSPDLRCQTIRSHVPAGSSDNSSTKYSEMLRKKTSPFQYFSRP